ncbi:protein translocase subunit SecF [Candidatus Woesebacteria bacterium]|nr:protein translocase subunit SecF [Candidatus Woesebacteria bacterium]
MNWMRYRFLYLAISAIVILSGVFSTAKWGFKFGIDFKGGTLYEIKLKKDIPEEVLSKDIKSLNIEINSVQRTQSGGYLLRLPSINQEQKVKINESIKKDKDQELGELRFESVGPTVGAELVKKTAYGLLIAAVGILLWVAIQFKSLKFGVSAILAMLHDSLVTIGTYSLFSHFFGAELDLLFMTALLTILSFSVHDTIIVYDRIRESQRKGGEDLYSLANKAVSETMVRSLNNSFTIMFMLVALVLLGGSTVHWFAATLLIGTISGAYSSPFVAVPILVTWDQIEKKIKSKRVNF